MFVVSSHSIEKFLRAPIAYHMLQFKWTFENTGFASYHFKSTYIDNFGIQDPSVCTFSVCLSLCCGDWYSVLWWANRTAFFLFLSSSFFPMQSSMYLWMWFCCHSANPKKKFSLSLPLFHNDENLTRFHFNVSSHNSICYNDVLDARFWFFCFSHFLNRAFHICTINSSQLHLLFGSMENGSSLTNSIKIHIIDETLIFSHCVNIPINKRWIESYCNE